MTRYQADGIFVLLVTAGCLLWFLLSDGLDGGDVLIGLGVGVLLSRVR